MSLRYTSSQITFNCVICFEEFDHEERFPMVLPCGHTYVCAICSKRLKRCMECRCPLTMKVEEKVNEPESPSSVRFNNRPMLRSSAGQYRRHSFVGTTRKEPQSVVTSKEIPIPLAKNIVLLALIDSAKHEKEAKQNLLQNSCGNNPDENGKNEQDIINEGIHAFVDPCGTYVVTAEAGMMVYKEKPEESDRQLLLIPSLDSIESHISTSSNLGKLIPYRQTLQIVDVDYESNIGKLARNEGFVRMNPERLRKISPPKDDACKIEGMLRNLKTSEEQIQKEIVRSKAKLMSVKTKEKHLMEKLEAALRVEFTPDDSPGRRGKTNNSSPSPVVTPCKSYERSPSRGCPPPSPSRSNYSPGKSYERSPSRGCPPPSPSRSNYSPGIRRSSLSGYRRSPVIDFRTGRSGHVGLGRPRSRSIVEKI